ncbi:MAG: hypothetical protein RI897_426 [Verrucomicrobiota bacterium]|jgi:hypothetical protein
MIPRIRRLLPAPRSVVKTPRRSPLTVHESSKREKTTPRHSTSVSKTGFHDSLRDLIDLLAQVHSDSSKPEIQLQRRDRALPHLERLNHRGPDHGLRLWLDRLRQTGHPLPGEQFCRFLQLQSLLLALLGLMVGWASARTVFAYDGSVPVNVVSVLAVFVGLQLMLLALLSILLLPPRLSSRIPPLRHIQTWLLWLSPGHWSRFLLRLAPAPAQKAMQSSAPWDVLRQPHLASCIKWLAIHATQFFATAFFAGGLATALYLVTFSDLAFSWSTTLQTEPRQIYNVTQWLSTPWSSWLPAAVPSEDLIRQTQLYRQTGPDASVSPERWGEWWPFIVACILTYGLAPRLLLLALARYRLHTTVRKALVHLPGSAVVWDRLSSHTVSTQAREPDPDPPDNNPSPPAGTAPSRISCGEFLTVNWGGLDLPDTTLATHLKDHWFAHAAMTLHAGGRLSVEIDSEVIESAAKLPATIGIAVFVKSWEPPVLELIDFLRELRTATGHGRLIVVCPVGWTPTDNQPAPPVEHHLEAWRKQIASLRDHDLALRPWPGGPHS